MRRLQPFAGTTFPCEEGVIRAETLRAHFSAEALLAHARALAEQEAAANQARLQEQLTQARADAEREVWRRAAAAIDALELATQLLAQAAEPYLLQALRAILDKLMVEIPAEERLRASVRAVLSELPTGVTASLSVHPNEIEVARTLLRERRALTLCADSTLARGACVLTADGGGAACSFSASLDRLWRAVFEMDVIEVDDNLIPTEENPDELFA